MPSNDWDPAGNGPQESPDNLMGYTGFSGFSGSGFSSVVYTDPPVGVAELNITGDSATISATTLNLNSTQTYINPSMTWAYIEPEFITPVQYTFQTSTWKYTFAYIVGTLFAPWLILWSKLTKRPTGIRVRNPNYRRPTVNPSTGDRIIR